MIYFHLQVVLFIRLTFKVVEMSVSLRSSGIAVYEEKISISGALCTFVQVKK